MRNVFVATAARLTPRSTTSARQGSSGHPMKDGSGSPASPPGTGPTTGANLTGLPITAFRKMSLAVLAAGLLTGAASVPAQAAPCASSALLIDNPGVWSCSLGPIDYRFGSSYGELAYGSSTAKLTFQDHGIDTTVFPDGSVLNLLKQTVAFTDLNYGSPSEALWDIQGYNTRTWGVRGQDATAGGLTPFGSVGTWSWTSLVPDTVGGSAVYVPVPTVMELRYDESAGAWRNQFLSGGTNPPVIAEIATTPGMPAIGRPDLVYWWGPTWIPKNPASPFQVFTDPDNPDPYLFMPGQTLESVSIDFLWYNTVPPPRGQEGATAVPQPGTLGLALAALGGLTLIRRRRPG